MNPCVLIPTFHNARTLEGVVRGALAHGLPVFVVDDGSTDGTAAILAGIAGIHVVRHPQNRGKGAALRTGFAATHAAGHSHAITLDSDGQHLTDDIPTFVGAIEREPTALFLGARDLALAGAGRGSRFGRAFSNFWTWVETGLRLPDTQTGFRAYPLAAIAPLALRTVRYDLEIEVLVKAAWTGVPIRSVPIGVRYFSGDERVTHLHPIKDFLIIAKLNTRLVMQRLVLPAPYLALLAQERLRALPLRQRIRESFVELFLREPGSPQRIAASIGLGVFMGLTPLWGAQVFLTLLVAHWFGASKPVAVVASHVSLPPLVPLIVYASLVVGRVLLGETSTPITTLELQGPDFFAWVLGSFVVATAVGVVAMLLSFVAASLWQRRRAGGTA